MPHHPTGPRKNKKERERKRGAPREKDNHGPREAIVVVDPPPEHSPKTKKSDTNPNPWWRRWDTGWKRFIEAIGLGFAISYAVATWLQWHDLRKNFEYTERAWIKVEPIFPQSAPENAVFNVRTTNFGKSAAEPEVHIWIEVLDNSSEPSFNETVPHLAGSYGLLYPGDNPTFPINRVDPAKTAASTAIPAVPLPLSGPEMADLLSGTDYIAIWGIARYQDQFGRHWSKFCYWRAYGPDSTHHGYAAYSCAKYNAVGDGLYALKQMK